MLFFREMGKIGGMKNRCRLFSVLALSVVVCGSAVLSAQSNVGFVRMNEDIRYMDERVNNLNSQVDALQRQNEQLTQAIQLLIKQQNELTTSYNNFVQTTRTSLNAINSARQEDRNTIITEVSRQIQALGVQMQKELDNVSAAPAPAPAQPNIADVPQKFGTDYPQTGVAHVVKQGDTLSGIARQYGSTVRDIQNANHISRPQQLMAGTTIFVPIRQKEGN